MKFILIKVVDKIKIKLIDLFYFYVLLIKKKKKNRTVNQHG